MLRVAIFVNVAVLIISSVSIRHFCPDLFNKSIKNNKIPNMKHVKLLLARYCKELKQWRQIVVLLLIVVLFKQAALDFVLIFGVLGAVLGTYGAGQNYGCYPVLGFDNMVSAFTHAISGFSSLYVLITGMARLERKNIPLCTGLLLGFCGAAFIANVTLDYNYMFLRAGDGTPYDLLMNLVGGNQAAYTIGVVVLFLIYIAAFYSIYYLIKKRKKALNKTQSLILLI